MKYESQNVYWQIGLRYGCCLWSSRRYVNHGSMEWAAWAVRSLIKDVLRFSNPDKADRLAIGRGIKAGLEDR